MDVTSYAASRKYTDKEVSRIVGRETDSDAMSRQAAVDANGVDKVNLKKRLDDDHNKVNEKLSGVTAQLADKAKQADLAVEKGRINNLIANVGNTDGNSELLDIRVNSEGEIYPTAGEVVRKIDRRTLEILNQEENNFYITDSNGNIMFKVSADGVEVAGVGNLKDMINTYDDAFYITDVNGNVIFKADADGIAGVGFSTDGTSNAPYKGLKLITIGDSLMAHDMMQKWLVKWMGVVFDLDENLNGKNGHAPMAVGGTAIDPTNSNSIYMRALDAHHYNPNIIILYAGQNDAYVGNTETGEIYTSSLGTINDVPYTDRVVAAVRPTFYSSYMGMVENLIVDNPNAKLFIMTHMPVRLTVGMVATDPPYNGAIRFETEAKAQLYESVRYEKVKAIRSIAEKYNLPVIDLWKDSGINHFNAHVMYGAVGGGAGQVHPNEIGYKRMAEVSYNRLV